MTVPASVEQPTSDVRGTALPDDAPTFDGAAELTSPQSTDPVAPTEAPPAQETEVSSTPVAAIAQEAAVLPQIEGKKSTQESVVEGSVTEGAGHSMNNLSIQAQPAAMEDTVMENAQETEIQVPVQESVFEALPPLAAAAPLEAPTSGVVRQREEDTEDEGSAAKRQKTEEAITEQADFKMPDAPASQPEPALSNGAPDTVASQSFPEPSPPQEPRSYDTAPLKHNPQQKKFLADLLRKAKKVKFSTAFLAPVDPIALSIPSYPDVVKLPMDLTTMEKKLKEDSYEHVNAFWADFEQIVQNSVLFNGPNHAVTQSGNSLRAYMLKAMSMLPKSGQPAPVEPKKKAPPPPKQAARRESRAAAVRSPVEPTPTAAPTFALQDGLPLIRRDSTVDGRPKREIVRPPPKDLLYPASRPKKKKYALELKFCEHVMKQMYSKKHADYAFPFLHPVDPVALNIPQYHRVIKKPMDLSTIDRNLKSGVYATAKEFHADMHLMFDNCFKFNNSAEVVHKHGKQLQTAFDQIWSEKAQWMQDHAPTSEPASPGSEPDESDDDDDPDEDDDSPEAIQRKIAELTAKLIQQNGGSKSKKGKKKAAKADKPAKVKRSSNTHTLKVSTKPKAPKRIPKLSLDQKREVSDGIGMLSEEDMRKAVQIIRNGVPALRDVNDDELELDIDEIPDPVVYDLWTFVKKIIGPKPKYDDDDDDFEPPVGKAAKAAAAASTSRRKNKPMSAREQEEKIALMKELESKFTEAASGDSDNQSDGGMADAQESEPESEDSESEEE
ncbi:Bromodomain-containing protein [Aulographum hederae CBS 113979]|uniref:Bromodomain-containing protein n=1 Tax=Aulographum hederae CBS 113979 TaxID=1176131 RepID=A0A6G1H6X9_9PEZI|nr:Bromodomain-containing protein [Aulographum hederae CBS 113979]